MSLRIENVAKDLALRVEATGKVEQASSALAGLMAPEKEQSKESVGSTPGAQAIGFSDQIYSAIHGLLKTASVDSLTQALAVIRVLQDSLSIAKDTKQQTLPPFPHDRLTHRDVVKLTRLPGGNDENFAVATARSGEGFALNRTDTEKLVLLSFCEGITGKCQLAGDGSGQFFYNLNPGNFNSHCCLEASVQCDRARNSVKVSIYYHPLDGNHWRTKHKFVFSDCEFAHEFDFKERRDGVFIAEATLGNNQPTSRRVSLLGHQPFRIPEPAPVGTDCTIAEIDPALLRG